MKSFLAVLKFELGNYYKNKTFVIVTILMAVIMAVIIAIPAILGNKSLSLGSSKETITICGLYDGGNYIQNTEIFKNIPNTDWNVYQNEADLKQAVEQGETKVGFIITDETDYTYVVQNNSFFGSYQEQFEEVFLKNYRETALKQASIDVATTEAIFQATANSHMEILGKDSVRNYAYTYVMVFILYFLLILYGQMIATSVTTEKSNRAIEILVTSVNTDSLIFGKVIAGTIASIVQVGIILGSGFISYGLFKDAWGINLDFLFDIPPSVFATFIVFGLLGFLLYCFFYGALGALVSKTEDLGKSSSLITIVCLAAFFIAMFGMTNSDGLLIRITSFIPFTSSYSMLIRVAMGTVALWEILLSLGILIVTVILSGIIVSKIFRFGTLMYGNPIKFSTALNKIKRQKL